MATTGMNLKGGWGQGQGLWKALHWNKMAKRAQHRFKLTRWLQCGQGMLMPKASGKKRWKKENPGRRFTLLGLRHQTESGWVSGTHRKERPGSRCLEMVKSQMSRMVWDWEGTVLPQQLKLS